MPLQRTTSLLRAVSDVRDWVVATLPMSASMVGYDVFLKLGEAFQAERAVPLAELYGSLRYTTKTVRRQLDLMAEAGLLSFDWEPAKHHPVAVRATPRFLELLAEYRRTFESRFILRSSLREQQLGLALDSPDQAHLVESLYDHFYDLGWLYADSYGSMCFLMSLLVQRAAEAHGHQARFLPCYVDIQGPQRRFLLGGEGFAAPGQIEGHAACVIDDTVLVDFGLGNARRGYRRTFPWALACHYQPTAELAGGVKLVTDETVVWRTDWQAPNTPDEQARLTPIANQLFEQYRAAYL